MGFEQTIDDTANNRDFELRAGQFDYAPNTVALKTDVITLDGKRSDMNVKDGESNANTIDINGERIGAPFVIKAIGLPEYLAGLERVGGYLEYMKRDGVGVTLEKSNSITIPKYSGVINFEYLQNVEE